MKIKNWRKRLTDAALILSLLLPVWFALAAKGSAWGWWSWRTGLGTLTMGWGVKLTVLALALAALALIVGLVLKPRFWRLPLLAFLIPGLILVYAKQIRTQVQNLPYIHDITTDVQDPPGLSPALIAQRGAESNPVEYHGKTLRESEQTVADAQLAAYPDLRTLELPLSSDEAMQRIRSLVVDRGWTLHEADASGNRIEATATTFWFGFKDDVVFRVRDGGAGKSLVDIRSISRVGLSDMGTNAKRIRALIVDLAR